MNPSREIINGDQTSPLKLNNVVSNLSKNQPSSSSTITSTSLTTSSSSSVSSPSHRPPVIIYTHSPKIIHTKASDFMALVQKLTGFSRSSNDDDSNNPTPSSPNNDDDCTPPPLNKKRKISVEKKKQELSEPSMDQTVLQPSVTPATASFEFNPPSSDVPLFMQGFPSEFFDLPNAIYKYPELPAGSSPLPDINGATSTFSEI